ncbi:hypothetical protein AWC38_SpisGene3829 [Stylophora pistillata]|uniref:Integrase catalytic domain-containing protein n=1 Tax=Stylophora pistillata TaxID=50429 RepID=A0A2B4SSM3_STYPI|nr:hypothetical protein AWC38_SpisGene3829 [Stylophora pistillata]
MTRLIVAIKQEESNPPSLQNKSKEATHMSSKQALPANNVPEASTGDLLLSQSANHQISNFQLLRRKEMILKMDINAVVQVIPETSKSPSNNVIRMENRVQKLNGYIECYNEVREEIIALFSDDEVAEEAQKWIDYQRVIDNAFDIAQEYISKQAISKADEQTNSSSAEHKQSHLKLPKLELPRFDGDVLKFQSFWDQFEVAIPDNDNVPAVQKFTCLRSVLEEIAYHTIEEFEVTSANYQHAVDTLKHRFVCRQSRCKVKGCGRRHHTILYGDWDPTTEVKRHTTLSGFVVSYNSKMQQTLLQTGTAMLVSDGFQRAPVRVLFDSGSQRSYITKKVAESFALDRPSEVLSVSMLGGETSQTKRMKKVRFSLASVQENISMPVSMKALTIDKICTPLEPVEIRNAPLSLEEEDSVRQFNEGLEFDGKCYEVPLLWKSDALPFKSNYLQAVKRLESVERQLRRNPERANAYKDAIKLILHSWPLPQFKAMRRNAVKSSSRELFSNMYVGDCFSGADDVEATVKLQQSLSAMMERGGFNLTNWASNSKKVLSHIVEQDQAEPSTIDFNSREPLKALGICWNTLTECFLFNVPPSTLAVRDPETKTSLLSTASRVFDPMGLVTPFTIRAKMLFQELWRKGLQWEDQLDEDITKQWRVAPAKAVSLPRLELLAAVVNARLLKFVVESLTLTLKVEQVVCWTDSMVTLQWIRGSSSQWKTFTANRVAETQFTWDPHHWKHYSGEDNPADLLTRGVPVKVLADSKLWWSGPFWLFSQCLPEQRELPNEMTESVERERKQKVTRTCALITMEPVIDPSRYEQWLTLIRVTAFVVQVDRAFKSGISADSKELSAEELKDSKLSAILKLDPYYDKRDHLLRVGGRLQNSDLPEGTKHPIILPDEHAVVEKIIQSVHKDLLHAGPEGTLLVQRQEILLTKGRCEVKRTLGNCLVCRRQRVWPCSQKMTPLPSERVSPAPAFTHVGIDFAGPLFVRGCASPEKAYICIFICASSRMTHLDLTGDLSTNEFFQTFLRMISTRELWRTIWSDNAKMFKRADHEIQQLFTQGSSVIKGLWDRIDQEELQAKLTSKGIKWKFIVERSPWHGGWWERLVRSMKEPLRKILSKALLSHQELATILTRIEAVINSRPLTTVSYDIRDLTPMTPAHLAIERSLFSLPDFVDEVSSKKSTTRQRYLYQQKLINHFWQRWRREYLLQLSVRNKWVNEQPALKTGDVVPISEDKVSRGKWPIGRVERLLPGKDSLICIVVLKTKKGPLRRPVQRLQRLDASNTQFGSGEFGDSSAYGGESVTRKFKKRETSQDVISSVLSSVMARQNGNVVGIRAVSPEGQPDKSSVLHRNLLMPCYFLAAEIQESVPQSIRGRRVHAHTGGHNESDSGDGEEEDLSGLFPRDLDRLPHLSSTTGRSECTEDEVILESMGKGGETSSSALEPEQQPELDSERNQPPELHPEPEKQPELDPEPEQRLGNLYEQINGVAMGSPLGPLMANAFLCSIEEKLDQDN